MAAIDSLPELEEPDDGYDPVSRPAHYCRGGIEAKDVLKALLDARCMLDDGTVVEPEVTDIPPSGYYWWGCAFKYLWRWQFKNGVEDLRKARQCIDELIDSMTR